MMHTDHCLATYGTLAPGKPNHHELANLQGKWLVGTVKGNLVAAGWGASLGFPALVLADDGPAIEVHLFISPDLPDHWGRLDDFEGEEYSRRKVRIDTPEGAFEAWMYLAADSPA